mmetsp:Transcript_10921/g.27559  ORF Transcript_10921/g.27559 Transcript_10921/m.27559 type:complete len:103 (-) Transcript_10921:1133-1441(-)
MTEILNADSNASILLFVSPQLCVIGVVWVPSILGPKAKKNAAQNCFRITAIKAAIKEALERAEKGWVRETHLDISASTSTSSGCGERQEEEEEGMLNKIFKI